MPVTRHSYRDSSLSRARLVKGLTDLDNYPYSGHSVLMGKRRRDWQDVDYILRFYDCKFALINFSGVSEKPNALQN